jgi:hypothetical protein
MSPISGILFSTELSHQACQKVCWRKIRTLRQAHSKPNKLTSHASRFQSVPVNFPRKLTKDKVVKYQSLELAGWYQTVPYLRLENHVRWHIAMKSFCQQIRNHSGALRRKIEHSRTGDASMTIDQPFLGQNCTCTKP